MKRLLIVFSILLAATLISHAQMRPDRLPPLLNEAIAGPPAFLQVGGGVPPVGGGCSTASDEQLSDGGGSTTGTWGTADDATTYSNSTTRIQATRFTLDATSTLTEYVVRAYKNGAGDAFTAYVEVWSHNAGEGEPDVVIADTRASIVIGAGDWDTSLADRTFTLDTPKSGVSSGTYWLVMGLSSFTSGAIRYSVDATEAEGSSALSTDTGSSWSINDDQTVRSKVFGCD